MKDPSRPFTGSRFRAALRGPEGRLREAASNLEFETAARLRDEIKRMKLLDLDFARAMVGGDPVKHGAP